MKLYSSVIHLTNRYPVTVAHLGGQHAHGAFLDIVRAVDPAFSARLHDLNGRKPFTVSPLMGLPKSSKHEGHKVHEGKISIGSVDSMRSVVKNEIHLREGWECWLRVTMLDDGLFKTFIDYFMNRTSPPTPLPKGEGKIPEIRLGDAHFCVREILTTPGSHPWAGYASLEELQKKLDEPAPPRWRFAFHTPTQFGWKNNKVQVMPLPKLLFGNLAGAWRQLTGEDHVEPVEKFAEENVIFGEYNLHVEKLILKEKPHPGGVGHAEYLLSGDPQHPLARSLNLLANLAFYSGVGRKTTMGMGMVRHVNI